MWILTPSITSAFAAATGASTSASSEQLAAAFARSLLSRSKLSPQRTWLQRLKRDSWTTHLSGAISSDSLGESFTDWWTSSLAATRANPSAQPASDSGPKTHDTSGLTYQPELLQCDQVSVSLKTSRDISALGYPTCCKTWQDWVTERRGAWRARVNAARLTRGSGSLSWPTISVNESKNSVGKSQLDRNSIPLGTMAAWTTPTPWQQEESLDSWETRKAKNKAKHYNGNGQGTPLDMQVKILGQADSANWPTPCANDDNKTPEAHLAMKKRMGERDGTNSNRTAITSLQVMCKALHGQAAPASSSSLGSRQELWQTPKATNADCPVIHNPQRSDGGQPNLAAQMMLEQSKETWWTQQVQDSKHSGTNPTANGERDLLVNQVNWATPRSGKTTDENPETWALRQAKGDVATMPLTAQVKQWATPRNCGGPDYAKTQRPTSMSNSLSLPTQVAGKLNPRWVETLMGLPIGWTMPSCIRPVTIELTSCDSSGMALCRPAQSERSDFLLASCGKEPTK